MGLSPLRKRAQKQIQTLSVKTKRFPTRKSWRDDSTKTISRRMSGAVAEGRLCDTRKVFGALAFLHAFASPKVAHRAIIEARLLLNAILAVKPFFLIARVKTSDTYRP